MKRKTKTHWIYLQVTSMKTIWVAKEQRLVKWMGNLLSKVQSWKIQMVSAYFGIGSFSYCINVATESGSRGAAALKKERTIDTFFTPKPVTGVQEQTGGSFFQASTSTVALGAAVTVDLTNSGSKGATTTKPANSTASNGSSSGRNSLGSAATSAAAAVSSEIRRELETTKNDKSQLENKVCLFFGPYFAC